MEPFTRSDLKREQEAFAIANAREYVKKVVENIYNAVKKDAIEMNGYEYYYTIEWEIYRDVKGVADAIREELILLFPDFKITVGRTNDMYGSRDIIVQW